MARMVWTLSMLVLLAACDGKAPTAAHKTLDAALAALVSDDRAAFKAAVLPDQRAGELGIEDNTGFPTDTIAKNVTLDEVLAMPFFQKLTRAASNPDDDSEVQENSARLVSRIEYGKEMVAVRTWEMVRRGDTWFIDMKATIRLWQISNGGDAFKALRRMKK